MTTTTGYDDLEVSYQLGPSGYLGAVARLMIPALGTVFLFLFLLLLVLLGVVAAVLSEPGAFAFALGTALFASIASALGIGGLSLFRVWRLTHSQPDRLPLGAVRLSVGPRGLIMDTGAASSVLGWVYITGVWVTRRWVFLLTAKYQGIPVPRAALGDADGVAAFVERVGVYRAAIPGPDREDGSRELGETAVQPLETATWDLDFHNDVSDFIALRRWRLRSRNHRRWLALTLGVFALFLGGCTGLLLVVLNSMVREGLLLIGLGVLAVTIGTVGWWGQLLAPWAVRRAIKKAPHRYTDSPRRLVAGELGFSMVLASGRTQMPWIGLHDIVQDGDRVYLFLDAIHAYVIPGSAFENQDEIERFHSETSAWLARARTRPGRERTDQRHDGTEGAKDDPFAPPSER